MRTSEHFLSRREFGSMIAGGASAVASSAAVAQKPFAEGQLSSSGSDDLGWIDAHVHVWTPDVDTHPLAKSFSVESMKPASFTPEQLLLHCRPAGVGRIVLIQMSFYGFDNRYMLDVIENYPGVFSGVGIVDHQARDVGEKMKHLKQRGVRGFRIHARGNQASSWPDDDGMATLWQVACDENLAVCPLINPTDMPHLERLCKRFPDARVVIDHFARVGISGKVDADQLQQLCAFAKYPNVHLKASAYYALGKKQPPYLDLLPMIRQVVDAFGPDRIMWASDCPFQVEDPHTYVDSIALVRDRADFLSETDKKALLCDTAERVFFGSS